MFIANILVTTTNLNIIMVVSKLHNLLCKNTIFFSKSQLKENNYFNTENELVVVLLFTVITIR